VHQFRKKLSWKETTQLRCMASFISTRLFENKAGEEFFASRVIHNQCLEVWVVEQEVREVWNTSFLSGIRDARDLQTLFYCIFNISL